MAGDSRLETRDASSARECSCCLHAAVHASVHMRRRLRHSFASLVYVRTTGRWSAGVVSASCPASFRLPLLASSGHEGWRPVGGRRGVSLAGLLPLPLVTAVQTVPRLPFPSLASPVPVSRLLCPGLASLPKVFASLSPLVARQASFLALPSRALSQQISRRHVTERRLFGAGKGV